MNHSRWNCKLSLDDSVLAIPMLRSQNENEIQIKYELGPGDEDWQTGKIKAQHLLERDLPWHGTGHLGHPHLLRAGAVTTHFRRTKRVVRQYTHGPRFEGRGFITACVIFHATKLRSSPWSRSWNSVDCRAENDHRAGISQSREKSSAIFMASVEDCKYTSKRMSC